MNLRTCVLEPGESPLPNAIEARPPSKPGPSPGRPRIESTRSMKPCNSTANPTLPCAALAALTLFLSAAGTPLFADVGASGVTELISRRQDGSPAQDHCRFSTLSGDGRWVTFETNDGLLRSDTNGYTDVYAYDRWTDTLLCASTSTAGVYGNAPAHSGTISADGNFVAFVGLADNLVPLDTNAWADVYVKNLQSGETIRVSNALGTANAAYGASLGPAISADGRYVAFRSSALDLVASDTNSHTDIFRYDTLTGVMLRVSDGPAGQGNGNVWDCSISADGSRIAFRSWATNLVPVDNNGTSDIFVVDVGGFPELVSRNAMGLPADSQSSRPVLSADGLNLTFESFATDLAGPYNTQNDVFLLRLDTMKLELVSVSSEGLPGVGSSLNGSMSADGRFVGFVSQAKGLAPFEGMEWNAYVRDTHKEETWVVGRPSGVATLADGPASTLKLSADASIVSFESAATNMVLEDDNANWDTFVRVLHADPLTYCNSSLTPAGCEPQLSAIGYSSAGLCPRSASRPNSRFAVQEVSWGALRNLDGWRIYRGPCTYTFLHPPTTPSEARASMVPHLRCPSASPITTGRLTIWSP